MASLSLGVVCAGEDLDLALVLRLGEAALVRLAESVSGASALIEDEVSCNAVVLAGAAAVPLPCLGGGVSDILASAVLGVDSGGCADDWLLKAAVASSCGNGAIDSGYARASRVGENLADNDGVKHCGVCHALGGHGLVLSCGLVHN